MENCVFMHRFENNSLPDCFHDRFTYSHEKHQHATRSVAKSLIDVPIVRTHYYGSLSIINQCIKDWNYFKQIFSNQNISKINVLGVKSLFSKLVLRYY